MTTTEARPMTAEELFALPDDGFRYELIKGELRQMPPPSPEHGAVVFTAGRYLWDALGPHGVFSVGDPGIVIERGPDTVRGPDVAWWAPGRLPGDRPPSRYTDVVPDLVVEVLSPTDTWAEVEDKVLTWLDHGARLVVVLNPRSRAITAWEGPTRVRRYGPDDSLELGPLAPEFRVPVSALFPAPA